MRLIIILTIVTTMLHTQLMAAEPSSSSCRFFVLKKAGKELTIESVTLPMKKGSATKKYTCNERTGIIDIIMPVGAGGSGNVVKLSEPRKIIVSCNNNTIEITEHFAGGKEYKRPSRPMDDLKRFDSRVSVTGANGIRHAFFITQYNKVEPDPIGPVLDMFSGKISASKGDYILFTNTFRHDVGTPVFGEIPLRLDRWPFVKAKLASGVEGNFIVDIGAVSTVISKKLLPRDAIIKRSSMVQYSSKGKKFLKYTPGGATGNVTNVMGNTVLPSFTLGNITLKDLSVTVMPQMPDIFKQPVDGIIGLDILRRAEILSFHYPTDTHSTPSIHFAHRGSNLPSNTIELPFTFVKSHLVVDAKVNDSLVHFIMDTGSPGPLLDSDAAQAAGVQLDDTPLPVARGMDGGKVKMSQSKTTTLSLGGSVFSDITYHVSPLYAFNSMRVNNQNVGLLGNSFFQRFDRMDIDFERRIVRLTKK